MPLTRYRDQAGIPSNAALIWDSIHGIPYLHRPRGNQSMKQVTIHHLNQDAPTSNILPVIPKGSFTPEIYYAIVITVTIRMGYVPIFAILIAISIHPIEKNCNIRNRNRVLNRRHEWTLRQSMTVRAIMAHLHRIYTESENFLWSLQFFNLSSILSFLKSYPKATSLSCSLSLSVTVPLPMWGRQFNKKSVQRFSTAVLNVILNNIFLTKKIPHHRIPSNSKRSADINSHAWSLAQDKERSSIY